MYSGLFHRLSVTRAATNRVSVSACRCHGSTNRFRYHACPTPPGIRRRIDARTPVRLARPAARRDVLVFPRRQRRGLLDPDHVVFQPQVGINVLLVLEMARDDPRPVAERQDAPERRELMPQVREQLPPQILEVLQVGLADLAQQQALQPRHALTVVHAHLRQQPVRLAAAARPAVADWPSARRPGRTAAPRRWPRVAAPAGSRRPRWNRSIWSFGQPARRPTRKYRSQGVMPDLPCLRRQIPCLRPDSLFAPPKPCSAPAVLQRLRHPPLPLAAARRRFSPAPP